MIRTILLVGRIVLVFVVAMPGEPATAQSTAFKPIKAAEIRKILVGREFTDETHWFYRFWADGRLEGASMGLKLNQKWAIKADRLCILADKLEEDCREVWKSGSKIELRRYDTDPVADSGIIRP